MHTNSSAAAEAASNRAAEGIGRLSVSAHEAVDRIAETAVAATAHLGRTGEQLREAQGRWVGMARDCVRLHPLASVGIAVGVGLLLSLGLRRDNE